MTKTCPACGHEASGRFCSNCGANLEGPVRCAQCDNPLPPGGRFCNHCGAAATLPAASALNQQPAAAPASRFAFSLPWAIAAGALAVVVAMLLIPRFGRDDPPAPAGGMVQGPAITGTGAPSAGGAAGVDLSSMTPREAADRLFNRVMTNVSSGDTAAARQFLPMALNAYGMVPDLDLDGRYHLAVLHMVNGDPASSRAQADTILAQVPNHLFGLFTAAEAAVAQGDQEEARGFFRRFLQAYDTEVAADRVEYRDHAQILPSMREEAQRATGGGGD